MIKILLFAILTLFISSCDKQKTEASKKGHGIPSEYCKKQLDRVIEQGLTPAKEQYNGSLEGCNFGAPLG